MQQRMTTLLPEAKRGYKWQQSISFCVVLCVLYGTSRLLSIILIDSNERQY
jgi:hypothetical protein